MQAQPPTEEAQTKAMGGEFTHVAFMSPVANTVFYYSLIDGSNTWEAPSGALVRPATETEQALLVHVETVLPAQPVFSKWQLRQVFFAF